jgi:DNA-binding response OmpR family regulator
MGHCPCWSTSCFLALFGMKRAESRVLVVEDEKLLNWSLASSLAKWGFEVRPVFSAGEALVQIEQIPFDVVMLDYQLPDLDGIAVARLVREKQPRAVIFLVTAFQLNELALDPGLIDVYFNKPLDLEQLHTALSAVPAANITPEARTTQSQA